MDNRVMWSWHTAIMIHLSFKSVLFLVVFILSLVTLPTQSRQDVERKLKNIHEMQDDIQGIYNYVNNITVYASVITGTINKNAHSHPHVRNQENHADPNQGRMDNIQLLKRMLAPIPLVEWPAIFTRPCPQFSHGHKTERGLALAHYQIWLGTWVSSQNASIALKLMPSHSPPP